MPVFAVLEGGDYVFVSFAMMAGVLLGLIVMVLLGRARRGTLEREQASRIEAAKAQAESIKAQAQADATTEVVKRREQFEKEISQTRAEVREEEKRVAKREDQLDQKFDAVANKERSVDLAEKGLAEKEKALVEKDREISDIVAQQKQQLSRVANMSVEDARKELLERVEKEIDREAAQIIQKKLEQVEETAQAKAREIIGTAIQRYASDHTATATVSTVDIPSDDMKGRVIGREGRNIRAFEKATGVDVIVDDTPGVVVVSSFDPVRREVARQSLEKLIQDGRIHPSRIEELVAETTKEVNKQIQELGKQALIDANVRNVHPKLVTLLGRLNYRTSYGQNVLKHSMEVAYLSQVIADELGLDGALARRAGLLHDIGKAIDHEVEGGHPQIGADLVKRYGEKEEVIEAAGGHHGDLQVAHIYTPIVSAADAISASRPGARRETLERYIQRLEKLEEIAGSFEGVKQAYAIQAGREVRVLVDADNIDDRMSAKIAHDIAKRVEEEMQYPGEVKVTLIREVRCVEYAR